MAQKIDYKTWLEETKSLFKETFLNPHAELDEDAAIEAFDDGLTPKEYITELQDMAE